MAELNEANIDLHIMHLCAEGLVKMVKKVKAGRLEILITDDAVFPNIDYKIIVKKV